MWRRIWRFLYCFCAPTPEVRYCWRTKDLVKITHTLQTGSLVRQPCIRSVITWQEVGNFRNLQFTFIIFNNCACFWFCYYCNEGPISIEVSISYGKLSLTAGSHVVPYFCLRSWSFFYLPPLSHHSLVSAFASLLYFFWLFWRFCLFESDAGSFFPENHFGVKLFFASF